MTLADKALSAVGYANPFSYDTLDRNETWPCLVCAAVVRAVPIAQDQLGRWICRPESKYWHQDGVFCGPEHSMQYHMTNPQTP